MDSDSVSQQLVPKNVWLVDKVIIPGIMTILGRSFWRIFKDHDQLSTIEDQYFTMKDLNGRVKFDLTTTELLKRKSINMKTSDLSKSFKVHFDMPL